MLVELELLLPWNPRSHMSTSPSKKKRLLISTNANGDHRSRRTSETAIELKKKKRNIGPTLLVAPLTLLLPNQLIKGRIPQGCRHEMPIKSGSLIKASKQEDLTELMMDRISKGERLS